MSSISPYLLHEDADAAIKWLAEAFGFRERMRMAGTDGRVGTAGAVLEACARWLVRGPLGTSR